MKRWIAAASVLLVAGCSSSPSNKKPTTTTSAPRTVAATGYGADAAELASRVPGCTNVTAQSIGDGAAGGMVAAAACTMLGHAVQVYTWRDEASEATAVQVDAQLPFSASGTGWTEIVGNDAGISAQQDIAEAFAKALGGQLDVGR